MNPKSRLVIYLLAFCALSGLASPHPALGESAFITELDRARNAPGSLPQAQETPRTKDKNKPSNCIGMRVVNNRNEPLAKTEEFLVDLESGRIVEVILSRGGFLGYGVTMTAVPAEVLRYNAVEKVLVLNVSKEKLNGAPGYDFSKWLEYSDAAHVSQVYRYYGATMPVTSLRHVQKTNNLVGMPVQNLQEEKIGNVTNVVMDLSKGRVVSVVFSSGRYVGLGDELSSVPPTSFRLNPDRTVLQLDISKVTLSQVPHFKTDAWHDYGEVSYAGGPYDKAGSKPLLLATNTVQTDAEITTRIREKIITDKNMSENAMNVKILTHKGKVTLRGQVDTADEKRRIGNIANQIALPANVDNQLQVKPLVSMTN